MSLRRCVGMMMITSDAIQKMFRRYVSTKCEVPTKLAYRRGNYPDGFLLQTENVGSSVSNILGPFKIPCLETRFLSGGFFEFLYCRHTLCSLFSLFFALRKRQSHLLFFLVKQGDFEFVVFAELESLVQFFFRTKFRKVDKSGHTFFY